MRRLLGLAGAILLAVAVWPELSRYQGERALRVAATGLMKVLTTPLTPEDATQALNTSAEAALAAAPGLPHDARPWIIGGSARLVAGRFEEALDAYRQGFRRGERAELDLNIGRAHEALGNAEAARVGYIRAGWVSPPLLAALSGPLRGEVEAELFRQEAALHAGTLSQPPPPPP